MAVESLSATGPRSPFSEIDHSVFEHGRFKVPHLRPVITAQEERQLREELAGRGISAVGEHNGVSLPFWVVDIHKSAISGSDSMAPTEPDPPLFNFGRRFPKLSKAVVIARLLWEFRRRS